MQTSCRAAAPRKSRKEQDWRQAAFLSGKGSAAPKRAPLVPVADVRYVVRLRPVRERGLCCDTNICRPPQRPRFAANKYTVIRLAPNGAIKGSSSPWSRSLIPSRTLLSRMLSHTQVSGHPAVARREIRPGLACPAASPSTKWGLTQCRRWERRERLSAPGLSEGERPRWLSTCLY